MLSPPDETKTLLMSNLDSSDASAAAKIVQIRIEFIQVGEIDTMNEKYNAKVKTTAKWQDTKVTDKYDSKTDWNPELYIENAISDKFQESVTYSQSKEDPTLITETRISSGFFWERMVGINK